MFKYQKLIIIAFLFTGTIFPQDHKHLEDLAKEHLLSLNEQAVTEYPILDLLESELRKVENSDSLQNELLKYRKELFSIPSDSAIVLFHQWYLHLSNSFYDNARENFFSSNKLKAILFSTSVSCYCTLKMCLKQVIELMEFAEIKNIDYWIIDSYEHYELSSQYDALFTPSVLLFDGENKLLLKIQNDEQMLDKLTSFFSQIIN